MECRENDVVYSVKTENDVEGNTLKDLGLYKGKIEDIAFHLADKCYYKLYITPHKPKVIEVTGINPTHLSVHIDTTNSVFEIKNDKINIENGKYYNSVKLIFNNEEEYKRMKALSKLTDEEKKLLGL